MLSFLIVEKTENDVSGHDYTTIVCDVVERDRSDVASSLVVCLMQRS
jgi:hypothetical protein